MLSENIRSIRESRGLSQEELAIKLNVFVISFGFPHFQSHVRGVIRPWFPYFTGYWGNLATQRLKS